MPSSLYTLSEEDLEKALEKICQKLVEEKRAMGKEDKQQAIAKVKEALEYAYPEGVPQDLFTDPAKQKTLIVGLISAAWMSKVPSLHFDLRLFFKAELQPAETKKLFKTFLTELNKLQPNPGKRRSPEQIEEETNALLEQIEQEKQEKLEEGESLRLVDSRFASDALDEIFETLFGINRFGNAVVLTVNKGNVGGAIDNYTAHSARGGSIHEGRGLAGDTSTDPSITAMAQERLLNLSGIGAEVLAELTSNGIIHKPPTPKPHGWPQ